MLGAVAEGDIGRHFPPGDEKYRDISSLILLKKIMEIISSKKVKISNIDATIVAEKPKMLPYINEMRDQISVSLGIEKNRVSIKATTTEGLGFAGTGEGIAAYAVCLLTLS